LVLNGCLGIKLIRRLMLNEKLCAITYTGKIINFWKWKHVKKDDNISNT